MNTIKKKLLDACIEYADNNKAAVGLDYNPHTVKTLYGVDDFKIGVDSEYFSSRFYWIGKGDKRSRFLYDDYIDIGLMMVLLNHKDGSKKVNSKAEEFLDYLKHQFKGELDELKKQNKPSEFYLNGNRKMVEEGK